MNAPTATPKDSTTPERWNRRTHAPGVPEGLREAAIAYVAAEREFANTENKRGVAPHKVRGAYARANTAYEVLSRAVDAALQSPAPAPAVPDELRKVEIIMEEWLGDSAHDATDYIRFGKRMIRWYNEKRGIREPTPPKAPKESQP